MHEKATVSNNKQKKKKKYKFGTKVRKTREQHIYNWSSPTVRGSKHNGKSQMVM